MEIRSVRFDGFGRFHRGVSLDFRPGLNVILGPNESGKSTLMEGVIGILFGLGDKDQEAAFRPRRPYSAYAGELRFTTPAGDYTIRREFETHKVLITRRNGEDDVIVYQGDANPRGRTDDLLAWLAQVEELTGLKDRDMAVRTLFMRQGELETSVDERVRHLLSGTRRGDCDQVLERLEERLFTVTRENPFGKRRKSPRELELVTERVVDLEERLERARDAQKHAATVVTDLDRLTTELCGVKAACEGKTALFESYSEFFSLNRDRSDLEKRLATLREDKEKVKAIAADCRAVEGELWPRFEHFQKAGPEFGETLRSHTLLAKDVDAMEEDLKKREAHLTSTPWPRNFRFGMIGGGVTMAVTFAALAGAGAALLGVALGLAFGIAAFAGIYLKGKGRERERMLLEAQVIELSERLEGQERQLKAIEHDLTGIIGDRRIREVPDEYRVFREKMDLLIRYEQILASHRALPDLEADYDGVFQKLKIVDARARDLIARSPYLAGADENLAQVEERLETIRRERSEALERMADLEEELGELRLTQARFEGASSEDVESLAEELEESRELRASLEWRRDALGTAILILKESIQEFQESHVERLAGRAGDIMKRISGGSYGQVALDRNFVPVLTSGAGEEFRLEDLSQGARDQLHLALRLAITGEWSGENPAPLLLDDVLVNCDQARLVMIRRVLDELAEQGRQILVFAHDPRYREWGCFVRDLDGALEALPLVDRSSAA